MLCICIQYKHIYFHLRLSLDFLLKRAKHKTKHFLFSSFKRENLPVDASALATFHKMVANLKSGGGVSFLFEQEEAVCNDTLIAVLVPEEEDFDGIGDESNGGDDEEEWAREKNVI